MALCYMAFSALRAMEYTVSLTQKISHQVMLDELLNIQSPFYRHTDVAALLTKWLPELAARRELRIVKLFKFNELCSFSGGEGGIRTPVRVLS